jgi:hypothetical protein
VVLDIGSGNGILSLLAAQAGAKRVYAVERTDAVDFVTAHAKENGFADVIQVVRGDLAHDDASYFAKAFTETPNVVIGELLGNFAPDEGQHHGYRAAFPFVRPDTTYIPASYQLLFAPTDLDYIGPFAKAMKSVHGLHLDFLVEKLRTTTFHRRMSGNEVCGPEIVGYEAKTTDPQPLDLEVLLTIDKDCTLQAVISQFNATLVKGIELSTSVFEPWTHWMSVVFPVARPFTCQKGEQVRFRLTMPDIEWQKTWSWSVEKASGASGAQVG